MKTLSIILAGALAGLIAPAGAAPLPERTAAARTADLDLARPSDVARLDRRIRAAAATACGTASVADLEGRTAVEACRRDATAGAMARRDRLVGAAQLERLAAR